MNHLIGLSNQVIFLAYFNKIIYSKNFILFIYNKK